LNCIVPVGESKTLPLSFAIVNSINGGIENYVLFTSITVKSVKLTLEPSGSSSKSVK